MLQISKLFLIILLLNLNNGALSYDTKKILSEKPLLIPHYSHIYFRKKNPGMHLGEYERYQELSRKIFIDSIDGKSCAVVGNSSNLIDSNYGKFIDSHDVVFRMNGAPVTKKYKKDIGSKTTVRFINMDSINPKNTDLGLNTKFGHQFLMVHGHHSELNKSYSQYHNYIVLWDDREIHPFFVSTKIENVSSGLKTLYYAMTLCNEVDVFGFGIDKSGKRGYYYDQGLIFNWKWHQPDKQDLLIQELAKQKQINLYMGNAEKQSVKKDL